MMESWRYRWRVLAMDCGLTADCVRDDVSKSSVREYYVPDEIEEEEEEDADDGYEIPVSDDGRTDVEAAESEDEDSLPGRRRRQRSLAPVVAIKQRKKRGGARRGGGKEEEEDDR
ncbi:hypothetical protein K469DRAFT_688990 [Zopfia rhizophila CBS 207.26]|uniref:Uncharacterized protein n=1 Tax=Zopfia rhizophila CBS 207.26 TaxID=1314779 RepID=A0A6A6EQR1_9PEZI|nr:hypothetical protein K469DRAFT_688990 [Zopfia rhizophila CBS 207.26]